MPPVDPDREMPKPDPQWLGATIVEWCDYWGSDVSGLVNSAGDMSAVRRLFHYRDEHARALRAFRRERVTAGPVKGAIRVSPMGTLMGQLEKLILPLEDRYGLSALARLKLGAELGGATKSLADLNASLAAEVAGGDDDGNDEAIDTHVVVELPGLPKQTT